MSSRATPAAASCMAGTAAPGEAPNPFVHLIGACDGTHRGQDFHARLPWSPALANSAGSMHGGALMGLLDYAMSQAARGTEPNPPRVLTLDMRTSFLRAVSGDLQVTARCLQRGSTVAFCEASALDPEGSVVATASATFKLQRPWSSSDPLPAAASEGQG